MSIIGEHRKCSICGEWGWFGGKYSNHLCKPAWECRAEWLGDNEDWSRTYAIDSEGAAEKFAEEYDMYGEYVIVGGRGEYVVQVRKPKDDPDAADPEFERFAVEGEPVPQYSANKIEKAA